MILVNLCKLTLLLLILIVTTTVFSWSDNQNDSLLFTTQVFAFYGVDDDGDDYDGGDDDGDDYDGGDDDGDDYDGGDDDGDDYDGGDDDGDDNDSTPITPKNAPTVTIKRSVNNGSYYSTDSVTIDAGDQVSLRWFSHNATRCIGSGNGFLTYNQTSGTDTTITEPSAGNSSTYKVTCYGIGGSNSDSITISTRVVTPTVTIKGQSITVATTVPTQLPLMPVIKSV